MQVVILAGGLGTRLGEYTKIPKPMVMINGVPILQELLTFITIKVIKILLLLVAIKKKLFFNILKN